MDCPPLEIYRELFSSGQYEQCLVKLRENDGFCRGSLDYLVNENNKLVCDSLLDKPNWEKKVSKFLELYNECNVFDRETRWILLFNCQWLVLQLSGDLRELWDVLVSKTVQSCSQGFMPVSDDEPWKNVLNLFSETLAKIDDIKTAKIFLDTILTTILIHHRRSQNDMKDTLDFLKTLAKNEFEFLARDSVVTEKPARFFKFSLPEDTLKDLGCVLSARLREPPSRSFQNSQFFRLSSAVSKFEAGKFQKALEILQNGFEGFSCNVQSRYYALLGRVYSKLKQHALAVKNLSSAVKLDKFFCAGHFYLARELERLGNIDGMLKSYQNLITATSKEKTEICLSFLDEKITKPSAIYFLAIAHARNEMLFDCQAVFEKLLTRQFFFNVKFPRPVVVLHEAAIGNLMIGNLTRAEDICKLAVSVYRGETSGPLKIAADEPIDYPTVFNEDVVGLLILAEIEGRGGSNHQRTLYLNQAQLILAKYSSRIDAEVLVRALSCKTSFRIAEMAVKGNQPFDLVDKLFRRALAFNDGDKDTVYAFVLYLFELGRRESARGVWETFFERKSIWTVENSPSLAIEYLLRTRVSQRHFNELCMKIN